jgi:Fic family protein
MPEDSARTESPGIAQADRLYEGFPDFSAWGELSAEDVDLWSRFAASLEERRRTASPESLKNAVEVAVRAAALDTGAIEGLYSVDRGFTMTVAVQGLAWQQMVEERGAGVRELFEAQLAAYELVLDAVTHKLPITEAWIRALHETLCAPQKTYRVLTDQGWQEQELPKGGYKTRPNHVRLTDGTVHAYSPVDQVGSEMHRLIEQVRNSEFEAAHPVLQASYCHYAFVSIHPFADGNGRVARALASTFFYRAQSIPLVIFENQRPAYLDALATADSGGYGPVISFFQDRGIDAMQLITESLVAAETQDLQSLVSHLDKTAQKQLSLFDREKGNIASRVLSAADEEIRNQLYQLELPNGIDFTVRDPSAKERPRHHPKAQTEIEVVFMMHDPFKESQARIRIAVEDSTKPFSFAIRAWNPQSADLLDSLEIRLKDVRPELTSSFRLRLSQWTRHRLAELVKRLGSRPRN